MPPSRPAHKKLHLYCIWSQQNIKRLNAVLNFRCRDLNYYDDFYPIFYVG